MEAFFDQASEGCLQYLRLVPGTELKVDTHFFFDDQNPFEMMQTKLLQMRGAIGDGFERLSFSANSRGFSGPSADLIGRATRYFACMQACVQSLCAGCLQMPSTHQLYHLGASTHHVELPSANTTGIRNIIHVSIYQTLFAIQLGISVENISIVELREQQPCLLA